MSDFLLSLPSCKMKSNKEKEFSMEHIVSDRVSKNMEAT